MTKTPKKCIILKSLSDLCFTDETDVRRGNANRRTVRARIRQNFALFMQNRRKESFGGRCVIIRFHVSGNVVSSEFLKLRLLVEWRACLGIVMLRVFTLPHQSCRKLACCKRYCSHADHMEADVDAGPAARRRRLGNCEIGVRMWHALECTLCRTYRIQ